MNLLVKKNVNTQKQKIQRQSDQNSAFACLLYTLEQHFTSSANDKAQRSSSEGLSELLYNKPRELTTHLDPLSKALAQERGCPPKVPFV